MSEKDNRRCVLVVDDDEDFQELLSLYLKMQGYEVFRALNGVDAIGILERENLHAIITEWMLPMLDGLRFLDWLRREAKRSIPVLVLTATEKTPEESMIEAGADAALYKPVNGAEILKKLGELLV